MHLYLKNWSLVLPECKTRSEVEDWLDKPRKLQGKPDFKLDFIESHQRRRLSLSCKLALQALYLCAERDSLSKLPTLFITRHGELKNTLDILEDLTQEVMPSPTKFIHSVHNTAAGFFSIFFKNRAPSNTISGGEEPVVVMLTEALACFAGGDFEELLAVVFDVPPMDFFARYCQKPDFAYAAAFHLSKKGQVNPLGLEEQDCKVKSSEWPQIIDFINWIRKGDEVFYAGQQKQIRRCPTSGELQ